MAHIATFASNGGGTAAAPFHSPDPIHYSSGGGRGRGRTVVPQEGRDKGHFQNAYDPVGWES